MALDFFPCYLCFDLCYAATVSNRCDRSGQGFGYFLGRRDGGIDENFRYGAERGVFLAEASEECPKERAFGQSQ